VAFDIDKEGRVDTKEFGAHIKATVDEGLEEGQFEALVSAFGNIDSVGDIVMPGAFKEDLAAWEAKSAPIPVVWSHQHSDPFAHIGHVVKAEERADGLWVRGQLDLDNPTAAQVYKLLKGRRITGMSFAYDVLDGAPAERDGEKVYELRKLGIHEVGPTIIGANREAQLSAVKARQIAEAAKAGRVLSQKNYEMLSDAHKAIGEVLKSASGEDAAKASGSTDPGSSGQQGPAEASGEGPSAKSVRPAPSGLTEEQVRAIALSVAEALISPGGAAQTDGKARQGSREASSGDAAMPSPASLRLHADLAALAAEVSTLTG
jgi:uncharacterized protein